MKILDIPIININTKKTIYLDEAISEYENIVLLGMPGSGKTSLFTKYEETNKDISKKITVKEFIKFKQEIPAATEVLLLDGLDEYRSFEADKNFVVKELAYKLQDIKCKKVISCRELDWYGDDTNILKDSLNEKFEVFKIQLLDDELLKKFIELIDNSIDMNDFIEKYSFTGLLKNPQLLNMIIQIYKDSDNNCNNKKEIFEKFVILSSKELNDNYQKKDLSNDEIFKYSGYLAFFYMFGEINLFDDESLEVIANDEYRLEILKYIVKTKIFKEEFGFIHRTVAEYLCAKFIVDNKLNSDNILFKQRIKSLFITRYDKVISELRGVYGWISVLTEDLEFIKYDPFYQLVYADNTFFNVEFKKQIILAIKKYSIKNPYFIDTHLTIDLNGFYSNDMEEFIQNEFNEAIKLDNHYLLLLSYIIKDIETITTSMKQFIEKIIYDSVSPYIKEKLLIHFTNDELIKIINNIIEHKIKDNEYNTLKENIIKKLYPSVIDIQQVVKYIKEYTKNNMMMQCLYLYDTPFDSKFDLVDLLYKTFSELVQYEGNLDLNAREPRNSIKYFIKDYFVEVCLCYQSKYTAQNIFDILIHFHSYYKNHSSLEFEANLIKNKEKLKQSQELLQELANELFELYVKNKLKQGYIDFYDFDHIFSLAIPSNKVEVFLSFMNQDNESTLNKELFWWAMSSNRDKKHDDKIKQIAIKYSFEDDMKRYLNPKKIKSDYEIKYAKKEQERKLQFEKEKKQIKDYFSSKNDDELLNSFNDLKWILHYLDTAKGMIDDDLKDRFKGIYGQLLKQYLYKDEANINQLAIEDNKEIDIVYYSALINNDKDIDFSILDNDLKCYLYILYAKRKNVINIDKPDNFTKYLDSNLKLESLRLFIKQLLDDDILKKYIDEMVDYEVLEDLLTVSKNELIKEFVILVNFKIDNEDLQYIINTYDINMVKYILAIKNKKSLSQEELILFYTILFKFDDYKKVFIKLESEHKIQIIYNMMIIFNDSKMLKSNNGLQTDYDQTVSFLNYNALKILTIEEFNSLLEKIPSGSFWYNSILNEIDKKAQDSSQGFSKFKIQNLKEFINKDDILDYEDFFYEIILRLNEIKTKIEDNRNNEKDLFFIKDKQKTENECRDIIYTKLEDSYKDIILTKEKQEANNRSDINIKYTKDTNYEIQVECKRDDNSNLYDGVKNQLIDKYFSTNVKYGIYLIFYFRKKKDKELMINKIKKNIPSEVINNIETIIVNLEKDVND